MSQAPLIPQPFLDWYGVWPGQTKITDDSEIWVQDMPMGVSLSVQEATKSEICIRPEHPWEQGDLGPRCVLCENGMLRLWYHCSGSEEGDRTFVAYAESTDGFNWERPELRLQEYRGHTANNLLFDVEDFHLQSVFLDPSAPEAERYKALGRKGLFFHKGVAVPDMTRERKWELRDEMEAAGYSRDRMAEELYFHGLVLGAVSADGLRWRFLEEPLLNVGRRGLDSLNIATYDADEGKYVAYLRGSLDRRRCVWRTEGKEFRDWEPARVVFGMDPQDSQGDDVYSSGYCRCPGNGRHLMFPAFFHRWTGTTDIQFASSRDGILWSRPERRPIVTRDVGHEEYGMVFPNSSLVPLDEETWGLLMMGIYDLHDGGNRSRDERGVEWRWAQWKPDRLVALEAPVEGRVTVVERECQGEQLRLNYKTRKEGGWVKVELVESPSSPAAPVKAFDGFGLEEADVLSGDELSRVVTWKGKSDLSALKGRRVALRIHMARAKIFSTAV